MNLPAYNPNKIYAIRLPTEADGFTKEEIAAIIKAREAKRLAGKSCVGDY